MILVDTSVWADHIRQGDATLQTLLRARDVLMHPHVVGEIALGSPKNRAQWLLAMQLLPRAIVAADHEVLALIERHKIFAAGIGYVDAHLLASSRLTPHAKLWTRDKRLAATAAKLGVLATP